MENTKNINEKNGSDYLDSSDDEDFYTFDNVDFDNVESVFIENCEKLPENIGNNRSDTDSETDHERSSSESEGESLLGRAVNLSDTDSGSDIIPHKRRCAHISDDNDDEDIVRPSTPSRTYSTKNWYFLSTNNSQQQITFSIGNSWAKYPNKLFGAIRLFSIIFHEFVNK